MSMSAVQAEDLRAYYLFMGVLNDHHEEWLGSTTTNRHGVEAFDFATVSGCDQLVVGPTPARGRTFDLLMTDVPELVRVSVFSTHRLLRSLISVGSHFHGSGCSILVY